MTMPSPQNNPLIGIWTLISAIALYSDGTIDSEVYGLNPTGYITYTAEGHMMNLNTLKRWLLVNLDKAEQVFRC
jgi:Lipocalin-like domain